MKKKIQFYQLIKLKTRYVKVAVTFQKTLHSERLDQMDTFQKRLAIFRSYALLGIIQKDQFFIIKNSQINCDVLPL